MTRDYANRKPRSKTTKHKRNNNASQRFPVVLAGIVLLGLIGFGYFLWSITGSAKPTTTESQSQPAKPAAKPQLETLPPKPKDEWTYQAELENKQVEVDLPEQNDKPSRPYQMQCASFRDKSQADEMKALIAFQGLTAQVRQTQGTTGTWYKVVLGPFDTKREAERERHTLQRAGINGCQIWYWEAP